MHTLTYFYLFLSFLVAMMIIPIIISNYKHTKQNIKLQQLTEQSTKYHQIVKENQEQISILQNEINNIKNASYSFDNSMHKSTENLICYTNYSMLNIVFNRKLNLAQKSNILLDINFEATTIGSISELDLITLYENLLDNAIEACEKIEKPYISCITKQNEKNMLHIEIKNSKNEASHPIDNNFSSTKKDKSLHGNGIYIIKNLVSKYNGNINFSDRINEFIINILLSTN